MTDDDFVLEPLSVLIGQWATEAAHPSVDAVVSGTTTFEWLDGRRFIVQRVHHEHEQFPDSISVIGPPESGNGLIMEYFDSRGVRRTYGVSLEDGVLRFWRSEPGFEQRFVATLDDAAFTGQWELAREPGEWREDVTVRFRRAGRSISPGARRGS